MIAISVHDMISILGKISSSQGIDALIEDRVEIIGVEITDGSESDGLLKCGTGR